MSFFPRRSTPTVDVWHAVWMGALSGGLKCRVLLSESGDRVRFEESSLDSLGAERWDQIPVEVTDTADSLSFFTVHKKLNPLIPAILAAMVKEFGR